MMISGHKTRSVFDRYHIVSDEDLKEAVKKQQAFLEKKDQRAGNSEQKRGEINPYTQGKPYIPDIRFRMRDPRFATQERWGSWRTKRFILEDFRYQKETDDYVCPNGKVLRPRAKKAIVNDVIYKRYIANREDCTRCPLKNRCIKGNFIKGRYLGVPVGATPGNLIKEMGAKVDTERGRNIYHQRIAIVEPVVATMIDRQK